MPGALKAIWQLVCVFEPAQIPPFACCCSRPEELARRRIKLCKIQVSHAAEAKLVSPRVHSKLVRMTPFERFKVRRAEDQKKRKKRKLEESWQANEEEEVKLRSDSQIGQIGANEARLVEDASERFVRPNEQACEKTQEDEMAQFKLRRRRRTFNRDNHLSRGKLSTSDHEPAAIWKIRGQARSARGAGRDGRWALARCILAVSIAATLAATTCCCGRISSTLEPEQAQSPSRAQGK